MLDLVLSPDFAGAEELREQAKLSGVRVRRRDAGCVAGSEPGPRGRFASSRKLDPCAQVGAGRRSGGGLVRKSSDIG